MKHSKSPNFPIDFPYKPEANNYLLPQARAKSAPRHTPCAAEGKVDQRKVRAD